MHRLLIALVVVMTMFTAACGDDGATPAARPGSDGGDTSTGEDPGASGGDSSGTVESDFGIPAPGGADLVLDEVIAGIFQADYPAERYDEVIAFFQQWIAQQDAPWLTIAETPEASQWLSEAVPGEPQAGWSITVGPGFNDDTIAITLATPDE